MKFHATLAHSSESCSGPRGGPSARAAEVGIELISAVQCQMSHSQHFVVETDDYAKLNELFVPRELFSGLG